MLLEVKELNKSFGDNHVLKDVSFTASSNNILGLLGRNGHGKSTTMKIMMGILYADSGEITVDGIALTHENFKLGYLPEAVLNYVALLGWSPGGEQELFTLKEMLKVFDVSGISKSPAIFDIDKLNHFNSEYIRALPPEEFAKLAEPYIGSVIKKESISTDAVAGILQARCEKLSDIPEKIDFFEKLPDYDTELYVHKKSKTDRLISRDMLISAKKALNALTDWTSESIHDTLIALALGLEVKNATLMWPLRIATAGKSITPGGAIEICYILGREETLRRIDIGIKMIDEILQ